MFANVNSLLVLIAILIVFGYSLYMTLIRKKLPKLRSLPGITAIDDGINRAVELGKSVHVGLPSDSLRRAWAVLTITLTSFVARKIAKAGVPAMYTCVAADMLSLLKGVTRDAYIAEGKQMDYENPNMVRLQMYDSGRGYPVALGNNISEFNIGTSIFLGYLALDAQVLGEVCKARNVYTVATLPNWHMNIAFMITSYDYTLLFQEYYAAAAYLAQDAYRLGCVQAMDITSWGSIIVIIILCLLTIVLGPSALAW